MEPNGQQFIESLENSSKTSILNRNEILAPTHYVSVFHETKAEYLPSIDQEGLKIESPNTNIGEASTMVKRNFLINELIPEELKSKGVSRNNIYAYPYLEYGHGLIGADQRYVKRNSKENRQYFEEMFETMARFNPEALRRLGASTAEEYADKLTDPDYLRAQYPGEILELKVDPTKNYVGDLEYITRIMDNIHRGWPEKEAIELQAKEYWSNMITLEEFLKWYKMPEWAEDGDSIKDPETYRDGEPSSTSGFYPILGAPVELPWRIETPEILIPENIPQEHIRVLK